MTQSMECLGSIILYREGDGYCGQCAFRTECGEAVQRNQELLGEALGRPTYELLGKFWGQAKLETKRRHTVAQGLTAPKVEAVAAPNPAPAPKPVPRPAVIAPLGKLTPAEALKNPLLRKKEGERLEGWHAKAIDPSSLDRGECPFAGRVGVTFESIFVAAALIEPKPTKVEMRDRIRDLQNATGGKVWTDASIQSNINIVSGALKACGYNLIQE